MTTRRRVTKRATRLADVILTATRTCIGSAKFGIEAHDAPPTDFPVQPSQKDGLGRMCKTHWRQYTAGLARDAKARKAQGGAEPTVQSQAAARVATKRAARVAAAGTTAALGRRTTAEAKRGKPEPIRTRAPRKAKVAASAPEPQAEAS